jgi:hypothetical protein
VSGWGWNDPNYGALADPIYFARSGRQTMRIQRREDGVAIDQIVLSSDEYFQDRPGEVRTDETIITEALGSASGLTVSHLYRWPGTYPLRLTISASGASSSDDTTVTMK